MRAGVTNLHAATPYNEVIYLESLRKKGSSLLSFAIPFEN